VTFFSKETSATRPTEAKVGMQAPSNKSGQSCVKIAFHCKNCATAGKRHNCAKVALCKIAIFWWV